jgi:hypothetical protein
MQTSSNPPVLDHIFRSPDYVEGSYGPVAIAVWEGCGTLEHAERAARMLRFVARRTDDPIFGLSVVGPNVPPPDSEVRAVMTDAVHKLRSRMGALANVVEGSGFRAAAMRGVLVGMVLLVRPPHPQVVCVTVEEAAAFLSKHSSRAHFAEGLVEAVRVLRQG